MLINLSFFVINIQVLLSVTHLSIFFLSKYFFFIKIFFQKTQITLNLQNLVWSRLSRMSRFLKKKSRDSETETEISKWDRDERDREPRRARSESIEFCVLIP